MGVAIMELKNAAATPEDKVTSEEAETVMEHNFRAGFSLFSLRDDGSGNKSWNYLDYNGSYSYDPMIAPASAEETSDSAMGMGAGSTTVVVVQNGGGAASPAPRRMSGVDGVVSNVFAKEELVKVDAEPTLRRDLCCESYVCCGLGSGGHSWFFKCPDCLGCGCRTMNLCGELAGTCKILQKPTFCEYVCHQVCFDMSTCCSNKGENDLTCCIALKCQQQATWCCILQSACKCQYGLMRTFGNCWMWVLCNDCRCSVPPMAFAPMQCTLCGFGYRCYEHGGCGCRVRADTCAADAPVAAGGNTTVVVINQSG